MQETPNENIIKAALINHYVKHNSKSFSICNELTISTENKIADIVICKENSSYVFEIKAWNDDFRRLESQISAYNKIFNYTYIITTSNHIEQLKELPLNIGIILFSDKQNFIYKRKADKNINIDISEVLSSMPLSFIREELHMPQYKQSDQRMITLKKAQKIFLKYLQSRARWKSEELTYTLHFEDILKNTDYVKLL